MIVTLEEIKKHLNLEGDFTEDDNYLLFLEAEAEECLARAIDTHYSEHTVWDLDAYFGGVIPKMVKLAVLRRIMDTYNDRGSTTDVNLKDVPESFQMVANMFHNYTL